MYTQKHVVSKSYRLLLWARISWHSRNAVKYALDAARKGRPKPKLPSLFSSSSFVALSLWITLHNSLNITFPTIDYGPYLLHALQFVLKIDDCLSKLATIFSSFPRFSDLILSTERIRWLYTCFWCIVVWVICIWTSILSCMFDLFLRNLGMFHTERTWFMYCTVQEEISSAGEVK